MLRARSSDVNKDCRHKAKAKAKNPPLKDKDKANDRKNLIDEAKAKGWSFKDNDKDKELPVMTRTDKGIL